MPPRWVEGKYGFNGSVQLTPNVALLHLDGYPRSGMSQRSWQERTTDAGRRWLARRAETGSKRAAAQLRMAFVTPREGWSFTPSLYSTANAGRTWRRDPAAPRLVDDVVVSGSSTWLVGQRCRTGECPAEVLASRTVGGRFRPLAAQPTTTGRIFSLTRFTQRVAMVGIALPRHRVSIASTQDGGASWTRQHDPCRSTAIAPTLAAGGRGTVWLTCATLVPPHSTCSAYTSIYQSRDLGRTWVRMTPRHADGLCNLVSISPAGADVAWAVTDGVSSFATVWRTATGGRTWKRVLSGSQRAPLRTTTVMALSATSAWLVDGIDGGYTKGPFTVRRTDDRGRTWQDSPLPPPSGL